MSRRLLIVEDSPTQAEALRALLETANYDVTLAPSGAAALEEIESRDDKFDAVLSDVVMPGPIDGYELCRRIKAGPHRETPILLLTSLSDPLDIINGLESGADNFVTKPYDGPHLLDRLANLLETKAARRQTKMRMGIKLCFMGREFSITSDREQILDLLISTFENAVRQNRELVTREAELEATRAELARYAGTLEADLHRFFELSHDMICIAGFDGYLKRLNPAWERSLGWTQQELLSRPYLDFVHPDDREVTAREAQRVSAGSDTAEFATRFQCKDGSYRWLEWKATSVIQERLTYAIARDVTERRDAQAALEARARQQAAVARFGQRALVADDLGDLFNEAVDLVAQTLELPFTSVFERRSDGTALMLRAGVGWQPSAIGQMLVPVSDERQAGYTILHREPAIVTDFATERRFGGTRIALEHGITSGVTVMIPGPIHPHGVLGAHDLRPREYTQDHVHFLQAIAHIIGTAIERHRTDAAFRQAQRLEAVGRLAGGVAHDFNNMLTAITGYGEMLRAGLPPGDPQRDDVDEILKAAHRAAGLTRQLLAFSRQQVLQPRLVNLNDIIAGVEKMVRTLIGEDIQVVTHLDKDLAWTKADPGQIEQVIMNLCVNARDAMPDGGTLTIETANIELNMADTREHSIGGPGSYVMLAVSDTGVGMDAETKARIYEPFFTTKPAEKGTGLGLATVYGIVKQSDGEIWVYSEVGQGTTFKVFLPQAKVVSETEQVPDLRPAVAGGTETVLLAEDEESVRRLTHRVLERAGYNVLVAKNGGEAQLISEGHRGPIHLLITDMVMPLMNGQMLADRLRAVRPDMRVLYLSGYTDSTVQRKGLLENGEQFLQKPFSNELLARKVREALDTPARATS